MAKINGQESICKVFKNLENHGKPCRCFLVQSSSAFYGFVFYDLQADVEEVKALYLDAKSSAKLLQEQQEKYIT